MQRALSFSSLGWQSAGLVLLAAIIGGVGAFAYVGTTEQPSTVFRWGKAYLPNVTVTTHRGQTVKFYDDLIAGKIVVISFVYTSCKSVCPVVLSRLRDVRDQMGESAASRTHFVSISIDPLTDTTEKLAQQAAAFDVGPNWTFITGDLASIDLIRYKLGERSGAAIALHKNEVLMFNDVTSAWSRDSAFSDLGVLAMNIRAMDPSDRARAQRSDHTPLDSAVALDHPGQALFAKTCAGCHTIGDGPKVGPDLYGVTSRRDHDWLQRFMISPEKMHATGDPVAVALAKQFPLIRMPSLGLAAEDASDLIIYLEQRSVDHAAHAAVH